MFAIYDIPNIPAGTWWGPISEAYKCFTEETSIERMRDAVNFIANYEYHTFLQILDREYPNRTWLPNLCFDYVCNPVPEPWDPDNYVLGQINDDGLRSSDAEFLYKYCSHFAYVYDKDIMCNASRILILTIDKTYIGHVYVGFGANRPSGQGESLTHNRPEGLFAMRLSLAASFNTLNTSRPMTNLYFLLLEAYRIRALQLGKKKLRIAFPHDTSIALAQKYGFNQNLEFDLAHKPLIRIPMCLLFVR